MNLSAREYELIVENSPNMIWRAGLDGLCNYFNRTWLMFTGRTTEQEAGNGWAEGVPPEDLSRCLDIYQDAFGRHQAFEMEYRLMRHDGEYRWINDRGAPVFDEDRIFLGFIGSCVDMTEKKEGELFKDQAQHDALCQIYNRNYMDVMLLYHFDRAHRNGQSCSLIMLDIDDFKGVNDRFGHQMGDKVLRQVADLLKASIREKDICGRYGGDEFVVIVAESALSHARELAERIRQTVEGCSFRSNLSSDETNARLRDVMQQDEASRDQIGTTQDVVMHFTVSCGVASAMECRSLEEWIERVDRGLYLAKRASKNRVEVG